MSLAHVRTQLELGQITVEQRVHHAVVGDFASVGFYQLRVDLDGVLDRQPLRGYHLVHSHV